MSSPSNFPPAASMPVLIFTTQLTPQSAEVFEKLCRDANVAPAIAAGEILRFVCRHFSGRTPAPGQSIEELLLAEFGDMGALRDRILHATVRAENAVETSRGLLAMLASGLPPKPTQ